MGRYPHCELTSIPKKRHRDILQRTTCKLDSLTMGAGFFPIGTIKFDEEKRFGLKK